MHKTNNAPNTQHYKKKYSKKEYQIFFYNIAKWNIKYYERK